jgi:hypothetical protein
VLTLKAMEDWSRLTRYPHHPHGDKKKYAMRQALLVRLNHVESLWNRMKSGGLGNGGAKRIRTLPVDTIEAAMSLRMLSFTGLALADQRRERKLGPYAPVQPTRVVIPQAVQPAALQPAAAQPAQTPTAQPKAKGRSAPKPVPAPAAVSQPSTVRVVAVRRGRTVKLNGRLIPPSRLAQIGATR